ncbi:CD225/dispanin family protein [Luteolibacter algae]|uniref:CD225/dispanin family protein n=1 Tax=Luteolibacter algae TaxID=454151 RepID=A0ABW5D6R7_9BACT
MSWYYSKNGTQLGPIAEADLRSKALSGEVQPSDLVWKEGMPDWKPLGQIAEFQSMQPSVPSNGMGQVPIHQPPAYQANQIPQNIPNYLWQSIVATVLCCMPFGVVAIVYAAKVDGMVARGDIAGAHAASKSAKTWVIAAVGSWVVIFLLYIIMAVIAGASQGFN